MSIKKIQNLMMLGASIFFVGMTIQFLAHTIFTYGLHMPSWLSFIRLWKEIIIVLLWILGIYTFYTYRPYRDKLWNNRRNKIIIGMIIISFMISLLISLGIHNQSIVTFLISAKFNYIPLIILCVWIIIGTIREDHHQTKVIKTIITTMKYVLIFSLIRYCILHTIPNVLDWIGFSQPGMSIERTANTPPPSLYLTDFYSGYVRNQWPFWWPLSLGFYLVALRPLFFAKVLYKKKFSDVRGRWLLYVSIVISTYSRATRIIFFVSCILLWLLIYKQYRKKIILWWLLFVIVIGAYILLWWESTLFVRTRSDKGHIDFLREWLLLIKYNRLRGLWAASVWPWSNHIEWVKEVFNPENQYMQIWLEYGLLGVIGRVSSYAIIAWWSIKTYFQVMRSKINNINENMLPSIGIGISIISLWIAGMVLHPFTDSGSMYPFMLLCGILLWSYQSQNIKEISPIWSIKEKAMTNKNKYIWTLLKTRTIIIWLFFTIQTITVSGLHIFKNTVILSSLRDIIFIGSIIYLLITNKQYIKTFYRNYKYLIRALWGFLIINILYIINSSWDFEFLQLLAGIKYDIYYLYILLGALRIWHLLGYKSKHKTTKDYIQWFGKFTVIIIVAGIVRQLLKTLMPWIFTQYLGFSTPSDFIPFTNPPIYYITWPGGIQRLSGFFVWPNTLWFFIIVMSGLLYYLHKQYLLEKKSRRIRLSYIVIIGLTLSRWAVIGSMFIITLLWVAEKYIINKESLRMMIKNIPKKLWVIIVIILISLWMFLGINQRKDSSNNERLSTLNTSVEIVSKKISWLWYGAWYSGPARHYQSDYQEHQKNNLSMLENIYLQILINQWIIGIWLFIIILYQLYRYHILIRKNFVGSKNPNEEIFYYTQYLGVWLLGLLSIWWFLHIFIDSMVNYLFFIIYGISLGYSISITKKAFVNSNKNDTIAIE